MMRVVAAQTIDMHGRKRVIDEALKEFVHEVDVERADQRPREGNVEFKPRTPGEIDDDARQRFVERNVCMSEAADAFLVTERLLDRLPERDADVLDRVMRIDVQIALCANVEIDQAVAGDLVEHVIEERHAGFDRGLAAAVQVDVDGYGGFRRFAFDFGGPRRVGRHCRSFHGVCLSTLSNASSSAAVPTGIRRQFISSGCHPCKFLTRIFAARNAANDALASGTRATTKFVALGCTMTPAIVDRAVVSRARSARIAFACRTRSARSASKSGTAVWVRALTL